MVCSQVQGHMEGRAGEKEGGIGEKRSIEEDGGKCTAKRGVDSKGREGRDRVVIFPDTTSTASCQSTSTMGARMSQAS